MSTPIYESETDDDEQFSIAIDDSILNEALASVEKRMGRSQRKGIDMGALDLEALAAVEDELSIEIEEEPAQSVDRASQEASIEARLRAMEAEAQAEDLKEKLGSLAENRNQIETQMRDLSSRAQKASEAQRLAEQRSKNLKQALEKQQEDVERLLQRRKKEHVDKLVQGKIDCLLALADVIDNRVLAVQHSGSDPEKLLEGVQMCLSQFEGGLKHIDVETILPSPGEDFNPEIHEAIANEPSADIPEGKIVSVVSRGYRIESRLVRAARVCVSDG